MLYVWYDIHWNLAFLKRSFYLSLILFLSLSLVSCQLFHSFKKEIELREENNFYKEASISIERGEFEKARATLKNYENRYPQSLKLAELKFIMAQKLYQNGMINDAFLYLSQISSAKLDISLRGNFFEILGKIYLLRGEVFRGITELLNATSYATSGDKVKKIKEIIRDAIDKKPLMGELEKVINSYGNRFPADEAILKLSRLKLYAGNETESIELLERFLSLFPAHQKVSEAKKLLRDLKEGILYNKNLIGCILPFSGKYAKFSEWVRNGIMTAVNQRGGDVFGRPVEIIFKDSEGSDEKSEEAVVELAEKHKVIAIIGPLRSSSVKACAKAADKYKIPLISPTAVDEDIINLSPYIFRNALTPKMQAEAMALFSINKLGLKNFAVIYPDNFYGRNLNNYFSRRVRELGGSIIAEESYNPDETDFQAQASRIKEKHDSVARIDGIYLPGFFDKVALIIPHIFFQGIQGVRFLGSNGWDSNMGGSNATPKKLIELVEDKTYLEGSVFTDGFYIDSKRPDVEEFVKAYKEAFDSSPNFYAAQSYDAACILINLLKSGAITREAITQGLASLKNYSGVSGITTMLPSGDSDKKLFFIRISNGDFEEIEVE